MKNRTWLLWLAGALFLVTAMIVEQSGQAAERRFQQHIEECKAQHAVTAGIVSVEFADRKYLDCVEGP